MAQESEIRKILATLYPNVRDARMVVSDVGFDVTKIDWTGSAQNIWHGILSSEESPRKIRNLMAIVLNNDLSLENRKKIECFLNEQVATNETTTSEYTLRDVVLGVIISLKKLWIERPSKLSAEEGEIFSERWEAQFRLLIVMLIDRIDNLEEAVASCLYGLPTWLFNDVNASMSLTLREIAEAMDSPEKISDPITQAIVRRICHALEKINKSWARKNGFGNEFLFYLFARLSEGTPSVRAVIDNRAQPWARIRQSERGIRLTARDGRTALQEQRAGLASLERELRATDSIIHPARVARLAESIARLSRFDIPLCDTRLPFGVLLGARLIQTANSTGGITRPFYRGEVLQDYMALRDVAPDWKPTSPDFEQGIADGIAAAKALLRQIVSNDEDLPDMTVDVFGIFPPTTVEGRSAGLPTALEFLRTFLDLPQGPYAASGVLESKQRSAATRDIENYAIKPLDELSQRGKSIAVREDGYRDALLCCGDDDSPPIDGVIRLSPPAGLVDAASIMWGALFAEKLDLCRRAWLEPAGFMPNWRNGGNSTRIAHVSTEQADMLYQSVVASEVLSTQKDNNAPVHVGPEVFFLGGPARTGKTGIAKEVAERLSTRGWSVSIISVRQMASAIRTISEPSVFEGVIKNETRFLRVDKRRIIIIDGIEYDSTIRNIDSDVRDIASRLNVYIIIVRKSDGLSVWNNPPGRIFNAIVGVGALKEFAARLLAAENVPLSRKIEIEAAAESRDLGWLVDVASGVSPEERIKELVARLNNADRDRLKQLAFASYWGVGTPSTMLAGISSYTKEALEPYVIVDTPWADTWSLIPSRYVAKALIDALDPPPAGRARLPSLGEAERRLALLLDSVIKSAEDSRDVVAVDVLIEVCWRLSSGLRSGLLAHKLFTKDRSQKIAQLAGHELIGRSAMLTLFKAVSNRLYVADAVRILARIMMRCQEDLIENRLSCSDFEACLNALHRNRGLLGSWADDAGQASALDKAWTDIKGAVQTSLATIMRDELVSRKKIALINRLLSFRDGDLDLHVALAIHETLGNIRDGGDIDTFYILKILDIGARLRLIIDGAEGDDRAIRDWARILIDGAPPEVAKRSFLEECRLEQLRLRLNLISPDWPVHHGELHERLLAALPGARMDDVIAGLGGIHRERPGYLAKYLNDRKLFGPTFILDQRHGAGGIADLAAGLSKWHAESAFELFYFNSELKPGNAARPNQTRAGAFAKMICSQRDGRNAGRLILAAEKIDELYKNVDGGFSELLIQRVGLEFFRAQFDFEERSSILFYLVEGLLLSQTRYADVLFPQIMLHLERAIEKGFHPWAARLAFRVCLDIQFGGRARARLQEIIERHSENVLESMLDATDPEAISALFSLAVLDKRDANGLADRFSTRIYDEDRWSDLISVLARRSRPDLLVAALRAIDATLRRAGRGTEGSRFLESAAGHRSLHLAKLAGGHATTEDGGGARAKFASIRESIKWRADYLRAADAEDTAALLDQLRLLNPGLARTSLRYARVFSRMRKTGILADKIKRLERSPGQVVRLLASADAVLPGIGRDLLVVFMSNKNRARLIKDEIQFIQNPRTFAIVARLLLKFDYQHVEHITKTFDSVWSRSDIVGSLRSVAALTELMKLAEALDALNEREGRYYSYYHANMAGNIDAKALERRISRGRSSDLTFLPVLITQLHKANRKDFAIKILRKMEIFDLTRITDIYTWGKTLACCLSLGEEPQAGMMAEMDSAAEKFLVEPKALDDLVRWRDFVLFAAAREAVKGEMAEEERIALLQCPRSLNQITDPGLQFLVVKWLKELPWTREMMDSSLERIKAAPGLVSLDIRAWLNSVLGSPNGTRPDFAVKNWEKRGRPVESRAQVNLVESALEHLLMDDDWEMEEISTL